MADGTPIEWTDATWNIVTGCSVVSPGCTNCYAMRLAGTRLKDHPSRQGLTVDSKAGPVWNGQVRFNAQWLDQPLRWRKPRRIFVAAHGDLFHEGVTDDQLDQIFAVMALCPQHTFQVLTKRPKRMRSYVSGLYAPTPEADDRVTRAVTTVLMTSGKTWGDCGSTGTAITTLSRGQGGREPGMLRRTASDGVERLVEWNPERWFETASAFADRVRDRLLPHDRAEFGWGLKLTPLPNVWLGVSVEDQARADERIPALLATPAALRWISAEPLLGPVDLANMPFPKDCDCEDHFPTFDVFNASFYCAGCCEGPEPMRGATVDWVVAGGESGPGSRPMHPDWARHLRDQCAGAGVPFLFKQWGDWERRAQWQPGIDAPPMVAIKVDGSRVPDDVAPQDVGGHRMARVGKKAAGRLLDGHLHDGYPEGRA